MPNEVFHLSPEGVKKSNATSIVRIVVIPTVMSLLFLTLLFYRAGSHYIHQQTWLTVMIVLAVSFIVRLFRFRAQQNGTNAGYELTINDNGIALLQPPASKTLQFFEVAEIVKFPTGGFIVRGGAQNTIIRIPAHIERPDELEQKLNEISPVKPYSQKYNITIVNYAYWGAFILFFMTMYVSRQPWVVIACGTLVTGATAFSIYKTHTSRFVELQQKRFVWAMLIFVAIAAFRIMRTLGLF